MTSADTATVGRPARTTPVWAVAGVLAAVIVAIGLRTIGLRYGLPAVYNPDEIAIMNRAMAFGTGDLNPRNFLYPTFYFYALFAWEGAFYLGAHVAGIFSSVADFERAFFVDPTPIFAAGRALSLAAGAATVVAVYALGRRVAGHAAGLAAAVLVAVAPLAVRDAHYVKHDVPVTLLIVIAHVLVARLVFDPPAARATWRWLVAGGVAGLAASTHYYAVFAVVPAAVAAIACAEPGTAGKTRAMRLGAVVVGWAVLFVAASPYLPLEWRTAWRDIVANREIVMDRATASAGGFASAGFYFQWFATQAMGGITTILVVAGAAAMAARGWRAIVAVGLFPVLFFLFIANTFPASRYLNPLIPFAAVWAGCAIAWIAARGRVAAVAAGLLLIAAAGDAGRESLRIDRFFQQDDTRTLAADWIARSVVPGASVLVQPYSVPLRMSHAGLVEALTAHLGSPERASIKFQRQLALRPYPAPAYRTLYLGTGGLDVDRLYVDPAEFETAVGLAPLRALAVEYVVLKRMRYNGPPDPSLSALDAALLREGRRLMVFSPYRAGVASDRLAAVAPFLHNTDTRVDLALERPGPIVEIWRIN